MSKAAATAADREGDGVFNVEEMITGARGVLSIVYICFSSFSGRKLECGGRGLGNTLGTLGINLQVLG